MKIRPAPKPYIQLQARISPSTKARLSRLSVRLQQYETKLVELALIAYLDAKEKEKP